MRRCSGPGRSGNALDPVRFRCALWQRFILVISIVYRHFTGRMDAVLGARISSYRRLRLLLVMAAHRGVMVLLVPRVRPSLTREPVVWGIFVSSAVYG